MKKKQGDKFNELVYPQKKKQQDIDQFKNILKKEGKKQRIDSVLVKCEPLNLEGLKRKDSLLSNEDLKDQANPNHTETPRRPIGAQPSIVLDNQNPIPLFDRVFLLGSLQPQMPRFNISWPLNFQTLFGFDALKNEYTQNPMLNLQTTRSEEELFGRLSAMPLEMWESFEKERETFIKFLIPFEIFSSSEVIKADKKAVDAQILRDSSTSSKTEFFFIAINPQLDQQNKDFFSEAEMINLEMSQLLNPRDAFDAQDVQTKLKKQQILLSKSNPNKFSFYYVVKQEEKFFVPSASSSSGNSIEIFSIPRFLVLSSRYPLSFFFQELLLKMSSFLREFQIESYLSAARNIQGKGDFQSAQTLSMATASLRSRRTMASVFEHMTKICSSLLQDNPFVLFERPINLQTPRLSLFYSLPEIKLSYLLETGSMFIPLLSHLPFEEFILILFAHVFEKKIVFISENKHSLCSAIATFNSLIKPFRWTYPVIYNLPEDCIPILQSPIPVQIGLNVSAKTFLSQIGPQNFKDLKTQTAAMFVFLDESLVLTNTAQVQSMPLPFFDDFLVILQVLYKKHFNSKSSNFLKISKKKSKNNLKKYSFSRQNKYSFKEKISKLKKKGISAKERKKRQERNRLDNLQFKETDHREIFAYFWSLFNKFIISKLPSLRSVSAGPMSQGSGVFCGDLKPESFSSNPFDQYFIKLFFSTQMFKFYLENEFLSRAN